MPDTHERGPLVAAAEQAAAGDYTSAERLLREALEEQERHLGPGHPDLAKTLNNLGVVCDLAGRVDEAEQCYRGAYAIAAAALAPDNPVVATSRQNLEDFCAAHGRPVDPPDPPRAVPSGSAPVASWRSFRPLALGAVSLCAFAVLTIVVVVRPWLGSEKSNPERDAPPVGAMPPPSSPAPPARTRVEPRPSGAQATGRRSDPVSAPERRAVAPSSPVVPTVVNAVLCRVLVTGARDWHCDPAGRTVGPGQVFFYSRLRSPRSTTVKHRWYRGDRLQQEVELTIRANPGTGYRTYSRTTMTAQSAGDWRVELRAVDGSLLHEERFTVR